MTALISGWTDDVNTLQPEAPSDLVARVGDDLVGYWEQPHRGYHTPTHLVEMFWALDELLEAAELSEREGAVARVAAWFHDAVYDTGAPPGANEADSAALAVRDLTALGLEPDDREQVRTLVLMTDGHAATSDDALPRAFHDADLWILSADTDRFDTYCRQIREEYARVDDESYARGRAAILEPFLRRDALYRTAHARQNWEDRARINLARELARLRP